MEHIDAFAANSDHSAGEMQNDERSSSSGSSGQRSSLPKSPNEVPQKLKTSERRRIQNRQAQKTYRWYHPKNLHGLGKQIDKRSANCEIETSRREAKEATASSTSTIGQDMTGIPAADSPIMGLSGMLQPHDLGSAPTPGMGSFVACGPSFNATALGYQTSGPAPIYRYAQSLDYHAEGALNSCRSYREDLFSASIPLVSQSGSERSGYNSPAMPQAVLQSQNINILKSQSPAGDDSDSLLAQFLLQDDVTLSKVLIRNIRDNKITLKDILRKGLQSLERDSNSLINNSRMIDGSLLGRGNGKSMQVQLPDLHANTIHVTQMSFVAAVIHNATMLGVSAPEMFAQDAESHFFASSRNTAGDMEDIADQIGYMEIKDDLKPTQNQLTQSHHPYIDTLPFRSFRERLIALMHAEPCIINMEELCHDLKSDGVICWGSSAGAGTGHSGAPWDIRSWEVRPWFLKKYWMITEGTEGEMYQQTRWWCELRGEDVPTVWWTEKH